MVCTVYSDISAAIFRIVMVRLQLISDEDEPAGGEDDSIMDEIEEQEGKIGAKKLRKLQDKAEKKRQREVYLILPGVFYIYTSREQKP